MEEVRWGLLVITKTTGSEVVLTMTPTVISVKTVETILIAMTPVNLATCAISTHARGQLIAQMNVTIMGGAPPSEAIVSQMIRIIDTGNGPWFWKNKKQE